MLDAKIPSGPIEKAWDKSRFEMKLVNPANKRKYEIIVVGSGLAGGSAAATLGELGYNVKCFCFQDSPRRAHSIAAQGGINAAKNYQNDGDSIYRLFYDTVKGGDFRAREGNVYRLAQISVNIIDQCVAQGVPFAREYGGTLSNRSFGGAQVSRTFYARGQTGQQLLLGAYQALERQVDAGTVKMFPRTEMLDLVVIDGRARGIITRNLVTGAIECHIADAVVLGTGGYGNVLLSCRPTPRDRTAPPSGAPTSAARCSRIPVSRRFIPPASRFRGELSIEAHADERIAAQRRPHLGASEEGRQALARSDPRSRARLLSGTPLSELRQSGASRRRFAQREGRVRRGPRRRRARPRRISRLQRRHPAPGRRQDPRALRQPVRDVRAHHGRGSVQGPDAHLSGDPLHDGRPVGGLPPDVAPSRACS